MRYATTVPGVLVLLAMVGCGTAPDGDALFPTLPSPSRSLAVDNETILVPPTGYPVLDDVRVTERGRGKSRLKRSADGATADLKLKDQAPGDVLVYATIIFNYPGFCVEGEDRLPEPGPCRANGPLDPRDGAIPEVQLSADAWAYAVADHVGMATFHVDLVHDAPTWSSSLNGGPGLLDPEGAAVYVYVQDKGPLAPEGPLRDAQVNTLFGGCQGPPAFGPLSCRGVALAQHLPPGS